MHDVNRHLRHLGQRDGALGPGRLGRFGSRQGVVNRRGVAGIGEVAKQAFGQGEGKRASTPIATGS